ncbi:MAG TPA: electron transfer flavoprotein subunit alpha/FixB family protein [Vicinamibacteria bacterium]|nr:electron transfer flavoprotein subunit alpha/FixB family protein [Vicinamibacteria bacterium]
MAVILTFAEQRDGAVRRASLEVVSEARRLASGLGATVSAVLVGPGSQALADELASYGADEVRAFEDPALGAYAPEAWARALAQAVGATKPSAVLLPFTPLGKDLAPRVAAKIGAGLASDCVGLEARGGRLVARRPMYAGKVYATVEWLSEPQVATLRPNVFPLGPPDPSRRATLVKGSVDVASRARVTAVRATARGRVELTEASVIVSGGRGLKGPENFHLVDSLAEAMRAAVGASRAVVDAGWVDHQLQVGQTGKTVSPTLYVACGISGAIQHLAGMSSSRTIVAINKDPDAPIFKVANYGILGDVFEVLPKLTEAAKAHFASRG